MKRLILPVLIVILGLGGGAAAGFLLRPDAVPEGKTDAEALPEEAEEPPEYVRLSNQFVVPVLDGGSVTSLVILSLALEVAPGSTDTVFAHEPKLRDVFLQVLFSHANTGGFQGSFTDAANLVPLRTALEEAAAGVLPDLVQDVLINDIARQDG